MSEAWITGSEDAARFIAAVAWPWESEEHRDKWAPKILTNAALRQTEIVRARQRLEAAIQVVRLETDR
jgi:hypothetical protein